MSRSLVDEHEAEGKRSASASRLLDTVLNSLYDFGESQDGNKKQKNRKRNSKEQLQEDKGENLDLSTVTPCKQKSASSFFGILKEELIYECGNQKRSTPESRLPVVTPPELAQQSTTKEVEVVIFHGNHKKKKGEPETAEDSSWKAKRTIEEKQADGQEFNLEKARLEVHRFGITGFEKKEQRVLEQERAIMLGAKPPKKQYLNYKILQQKIKEEKALKKEENMMENTSDSMKRQKKRGQEERQSKKKRKESILPTGQVGTFKNGTLILRSSDIKKIKSSKVVK
uniref:Chromosome 1 open reading frame 131 n=1 Tax=Salvator merianae TaxID=96440 RepID=A0A8D0EAI0_SALMN